MGLSRAVRVLVDLPRRRGKDRHHMTVLMLFFRPLRGVPADNTASENQYAYRHKEKGGIVDKPPQRFDGKALS